MACNNFIMPTFLGPDLSVLNYTWNQSTSLANETTGYFENDLGNPVAIGVYASNNGRYITEGSLVKFVAPTGEYFDANNRLQVGTPSNPDEKTTIWASPTAVYLSGTAEGLGQFAQWSWPSGVEQFCAHQSYSYPGHSGVCHGHTHHGTTKHSRTNFFESELWLGYNNLTNTWYVITAGNLATNANFSLSNAQSTAGTNSDALGWCRPPLTVPLTLWYQEVWNTILAVCYRPDFSFIPAIPSMTAVQAL
jgi:hypothetical protein